MITSRHIVPAIAAGLLGFLLGTLTGPIDLRPQGPLQRENAALREQVRLLTTLVDTYKAEQRAVRAVLEGK